MTDKDIYLKFENQDVRYPEIRTAFLQELEPVVLGETVKHYNYRGKVTQYRIKELIDVYDVFEESLFGEEYVSSAIRYIVAVIHYFTPNRNLERFRTVRLPLTESGLECSC